MKVVCINQVTLKCTANPEFYEYANPHEKFEWEDEDLVCPITGLNGGYMEIFKSGSSKSGLSHLESKYFGW